MKRLIAFAISAALPLLAFIPAMTSCSERITDDTGIGEDGKPSGPENGGAGEPFEITVTELHCKSGEVDIYGQLYTPEGKEGRLPVIVLSHSSSLTHAAMAPYAKYLSGKGYAAYCFDFCGACNSSKSTGRSTDEMTVFTEVEDLEIVLGQIRSLDIVDPDNVFVLGSSQGGLVTALTAEKHSADIKGMILFYPAFNMPELISKFTSSSGTGSFPGWQGGTGSGSGNMGMSDAFVNSIKDYDVYANIGTYPNDIIILHGTNDFLVDIKYSEQAVEKYPSAALYPIQGGSHGFNNENLNGMASMVGGEKDDVVMPYVFDYLAACTGQPD